MKKSRLVFLFLALSLPAIAASVVAIVYQTQSGIALTAPVPTALSGHPLSSALAVDAGLTLASSFAPTHVWCEVESNGTITGGTLRWWKQSNQRDGGWGLAPGLDEVITNLGHRRFVSLPLDLVGTDGKIYCQPSAVTETGGDGGLTVHYGFRMERPL